jgi:hypothetical protein
MKKTLNQNFVKCAKMTAAAAVSALIFSACTKSSTVANTGPILPAEAIRGTTLNKGNVKGVMLADSTYTMNGDLTVLPTDTLLIQAGATINVTGNHAFYIQGIIQSMGTQAKPITFTSTTGQAPGQWGGFQCDSAKAVTFQWTKILWTGGLDSSGSTRQTIGISSPIPVDIEDCWLIGGQDNAIGVYSTATVKILRNTLLDNGLGDGDAIDFHAGVTGTVAYNVLWGGAGSAIKVYTSATIANPQTNVDVYNNTCVDNGFRRGAAEPGRGVLVDAFSKARVYNNLMANNYWSLDITTSSDYANTKYGYNYFYTTVDSLKANFYPAGDKGTPQSTDVIDKVNTGTNNPMFVAYPTPPNPTNRTNVTGYDFHLKAGSPALGKGTTAYTPVAAGSPALSADMGAYVSDTTGGKGNRH